MNSQNLKHFADEGNIEEQAQAEILRILNDKCNLNPDKLNQLTQFYRKRQNELDGQIAVSIQNQLENVNYAKEFIGDSVSNLDKIKQELSQMDKFWSQEVIFHDEMQIYEKISTFRKNIQTFLDELKYFYDVNAQILKMEKCFESENYDYIFFKLHALIELRDNVLEKMKTSTKDTEVLLREFEQLTTFERKFYDALFGRLAKCIQLAKENPKSLLQLANLLEQGDKLMLEKKKDPIYKQKAIKVINWHIDEKFKEQYKGITEVQAIIQKSQFVEADIKDIIKYVVRCFPEHYQILQVFESQYRKNIEQLVMPILEKEIIEKKQYGSLLDLMRWVDTIENIMRKSGVNESEYAFLKNKIKAYIPNFLQHVEKEFRGFVKRAITQDKTKLATFDAIQKMIQNQQELASYFPEDIFKYVNDSLDILGNQLTGDYFIEYLQTVSSAIKDALIEEKQDVQAQFNVLEPDKNEIFIYKVILYINNYWQCVTNVLETKKKAAEFIREQHQEEKIDKIFVNDLTKPCKDCIQDFYTLICSCSFQEINLQVVPSLFTQEWLDKELMEISLQTLMEYVQGMQGRLKSAFHLNQIMKLLFEHLVNLYLEKLILQVQRNFPKTCENFQPKLIQLPPPGKGSKEDKKQQQLNIFNNKQLMTQSIQKDSDMFLKYAREQQQSLGPQAVSKLENYYKYLLQMLTCSRVDLEALLNKLMETYSYKAPFLLEVVLCIREDEVAFKKSLLKRALDLQQQQLAQQQQQAQAQAQAQQQMQLLQSQQQKAQQQQLPAQSQQPPAQ